MYQSLLIKRKPILLENFQELVYLILKKFLLKPVFFFPLSIALPSDLKNILDDVPLHYAQNTDFQNYIVPIYLDLYFIEPKNKDFSKLIDIIKQIHKSSILMSYIDQSLPLNPVHSMPFLDQLGNNLESCGEFSGTFFRIASKYLFLYIKFDWLEPVHSLILKTANHLKTFENYKGPVESKTILIQTFCKSMVHFLILTGSKSSYQQVSAFSFYFIRQFTEPTPFNYFLKLYIFQFLFSEFSFLKYIITQPFVKNPNKNKDFVHFNSIISQFFYSIEKSFVVNTFETIHQASISINAIVTTLVKYFPEKYLLMAAKWFSPLLSIIFTYHEPLAKYPQELIQFIPMIIFILRYEKIQSLARFFENLSPDNRSHFLTFFASIIESKVSPLILNDPKNKDLYSISYFQQKSWAIILALKMFTDFLADSTAFEDLKIIQIIFELHSKMLVEDQGSQAFLLVYRSLSSFIRSFSDKIFCFKNSISI